VSKLPVVDDPCCYGAIGPRDGVDTPAPAIGALHVGAPGKVGVLDLGLAPIGAATRVVRHYQRLPLYCFHPLYVDPLWPEMAFVYALQAGEGVVQGDRYRIEIDCAPGAAVHFTTPAATKIFGMPSSYASQSVNVTIGAGAFVEFLPEPVLPFRGSRYLQRTRIRVEPGATAIFAETLLPGRVARGESHAYDLYCTDMEVHGPDGRLLAADRLELRPSSRSVRSLGCLGPHDVLASVYVVTRESPAKLVKRLREVLAAHHDVFAGASELPNHCGVMARAFGQSSMAIARAVRAVWNAARLAVAGVQAPDVRKI